MAQQKRAVQWSLMVLAILAGLPTQGQTQTSAPLTLNQATASALRHHPMLDAARAEQQRAAGTLRGARSNEFPTISAGEDILYSSDPVFAFGSKLRQAQFSTADFGIDSLNHPANLSNFSASATANWSAFDGGSTRHKVSAAQATLHATELSAQYTSEQVATRVARLFYRALLAEDEIAVAQAAMTRSQEVSGGIQDRVRAGLSLESDGARADLSVQTSNDDLTAAKDNATLARRDLFDAIGESDSGQPLERPVVENNQRAATNLQDRLDMQVLHLQQQAAKQNIQAVHSALLPQVSVFGHVENDAQYFVTHGSGNWTVGAKVQFTVFDGGARKARELEATTHLHALEAQEKSTLLDARTNIASLTNQVKDLERRLNTAKTAIHVQQDSLATARDRYANGLVTLSDVLNAESDLAAADYQRLKVFYQLCTTNAELALADGSMTISKAGQP
ncbi:MAG: TolC family protein [Acidobacteriota bacterium]